MSATGYKPMFVRGNNRKQKIHISNKKAEKFVLKMTQ